MSSMSEASMPFQPAMEEPSNAWPRAELVFVEVGDRHGHVLFLAAGVGEAEVDELDFVVLHHLHHVCDGLGCHQFLLGIGWLLREFGVDSGNAGSVPKLVHGRTPVSRAIVRDVRPFSLRKPCGTG
jgi:hypothetical protein